MSEPGDRLGDYTLVGLLGKGAMGEVWLAEHASGERVALKLMRGELEPESQAAARFAREIELLAGLDHPGITRARSGLEQAGETLYYAMELVLGRNLAAVLAAGGPLEPLQATTLTRDVLGALQAAHEAGIVHRDVKPQNVLLDRQGRARLTDFGLARAGNRSRLTLDASVLGTPAYMSPEQAEGREATPRSDLYAVGALLFELLTGSPPFTAESPLALLRQHVEAPPPKLSSRLPGCPPELEAALARALAKSPEDRFPSAAAMAEALGATRANPSEVPGTTLVLRVAETAALEPQPLLDGEPEQPETIAPPEPPPRGVAAGLLALVAVLALGALLASFALREPRAATPSATPRPPASKVPTATPTPAPAPPIRIRLRDGRELAGWLVRIDSEGLSCRLEGGEVQTFAPDVLLGWEHREDPPR